MTFRHDCEDAENSAALALVPSDTEAGSFKRIGLGTNMDSTWWEDGNRTEIRII